MSSTTHLKLQAEAFAAFFQQKSAALNRETILCCIVPAALPTRRVLDVPANLESESLLISAADGCVPLEIRLHGRVTILLLPLFSETLVQAATILIT